MLRIVVLVAAGIFLTAAVIGFAIDPMTWPTLAVAIVMMLGIVFERLRYGAAQRPPTDGAWQETSERFIDDASGKAVSVWFDPATGQRRYVELDERRPQ